MSEVPWPLSSYDGDWYAFDGSWTRYEAASEMVYNLRDWYLEDYLTIDDDDCVHGWVTGYRQLLTNLERGFIRPIEEGDNVEGEEGWWVECNSDHPLAVSAWIWKEGYEKDKEVGDADIVDRAYDSMT